MSSTVEKSIIRIFTEDGSIVGAGFLISARYALTCAHVAAAATGANARLTDKPTDEIRFDFPFVASNDQLSGRVAMWLCVRSGEGDQPNSDEDIAVIELSGHAPRGCLPASLVVSDDLKGLEFHSLGFPKNFDKGVPASGMVKGPIAGGCVVIEDAKQHGYFVKRGFSGGPAWVEDNDLEGVIGMVVSADEKNRSAYIIPARALMQILPASKAAYRVPHKHNPYFTGRDRLFEEMRGALETEGAAALAGLGGMGKTQLATEYAYHHADEYRVIWWINAEESATLTADYTRLAEELGLPEKGQQDQRVIIDAVRRWLEANAGWLIIFDNALVPEQLADYLTENRTGHTIITSRHEDWSAVASSLAVEELEREKSIEFLLKRTKQTDAAAARRLADELGDLPLALEHAGAYINRVRGTTLAKYVELYRTRRQELMQRDKPPIGYRATVATTWEISFQKVKAESPAAAALLSLLAFVGSNDIPRAMVCEGADHLPAELAEAVIDDLKLGDAIEALLHYSLIESDEEIWDVHRLVQAVVRDRMSEDERKQWAEAAVKIVNDVFPNVEFETWPVCEQLLQHALSSAEYAEALQVASDATARLLNQTGLYQQDRAQFAEAKEAFERAIKIDEATYGPDHPTVAIRVNNLGSVLQDLGDLQNARLCFERALRIFRQFLGDEHPSTKTVLNNLNLLP